MTDIVRVRVDASWRRPTATPADGRVVLAGSPLRLFRLSEGGAQVIAEAEQGTVPDTLAVRRRGDRVVDAGALHPLPDAGPFGPSEVTVVMPCHARLPASLGSTALADLPVVVVDDASPIPLALDMSPADTGDRTVVIHRADNGGPAAARNTGLAEVTTPLVAFVDADVLLPDGWLTALLAQFADDRVALVAPRIVSANGDGPVARHEQRHCPLDLGAEPARIAAGTRVSYVPAAVLVCRTDALRAIGGFDEGMRLGEDVDLVWRFAEAGYRCRYQPDTVARHEPRSTLAAMLRQRAGYGRSAASLARRHRGALAPVRTSGWSVAVWLLAVLRRPLLSLGLLAATTTAMQRRLRDLPPRESLRLAVAGHMAAGRQLADATVRVWWPIAVVVAVMSRRVRAVVLAALVVPTLGDALRMRSLRPLPDLPLWAVDRMAYGAGVWWGVIVEREPGPLLPTITNLPMRGAG